MNDSLGDMIVRIKNAGRAKKSHALIPYSGLNMTVAEKLSERGFVGAVEKKGKTHPQISVEILYTDAGAPKIEDASRVSKLSRRIYKGYREIKPVRRGHGVLIVSTPQGVMTGEEARKAKVGGEVLCSMW